MNEWRDMYSKWIAVAVAALIACLVAAPVGASASGSDGPNAAAAKKKCKKKHGKKKKCKKKTHPLPAPAPAVRAQISWSTGDVDLHAYDPLGLHSGWETGPNAVVQGIPNAVHSPDAASGGSETFTDNIYVVGGPANREFNFLVCSFASTTITATTLSAQGVPSTQTIPASPGDAFTTGGGSFTPPGTNPCGF
jgi:hypothetical protein